MTAAAKRAEVVQWLEATRTRQTSYSFRLVTAQLRAVGFPTSTGWPNLLEKARNVPINDPKVDWDSYLEAARRIYESAMFCGTSATFLFEFTSRSAGAAVARQLDDFLDSTSPFARTYPAPLPHSSLQRAPFSPAFVAHAEAQHRHMLVACGKRAYREREVVVPSEYAPAVRAVLEEFAEIYAIRRGVRQAFDRLVVEQREGRAELHIDMCVPLNSEELVVMAQTYRDRLNAAARTMGLADWLKGPTNVFPKIAEFYNEGTGNVVSLGHATGTKSVKEERMRSKVLDLRVELFHKHGIAAIQTTDAFSIKKGWQAARGHVPTIQIPGHFSMAGAATPVASYAVIDGCMNQVEFDDLVSKLR
jgi:hypothetical protein